MSIVDFVSYYQSTDNLLKLTLKLFLHAHFLIVTYVHQSCSTFLWSWCPLFCVIQWKVCMFYNWVELRYTVEEEGMRSAYRVRPCGGRYGTPWLLCGESSGHWHCINGSTAAGETLVWHTICCTTIKWPEVNLDNAFCFHAVESSWIFVHELRQHSLIVLSFSWLGNWMCRDRC